MRSIKQFFFDFPIRITILVSSLFVFCLLLLMAGHIAHIQSVSEPAVKPIILIVPHHDLIVDKLDDFYSFLPRNKLYRINEVVIIAPNHFFPDTTQAVTINSPIEFPADHHQLLTLVPNQEITTLWKEQTHIASKETFMQEHAIALHIPAIKRTFPQATITPLLLTRRVSVDDLDALLTQLMQFNQLNQTIFIVSTDFSHDLPLAKTSQRDAQTIELIKQRNSDQIKHLNDSYVDCPSCLYLSLKLSQQLDMRAPQLLYYGTANQFTSLSDHEPTTSYQIWLIQ